MRISIVIRLVSMSTLQVVLLEATVSDVSDGDTMMTASCTGSARINGPTPGETKATSTSRPEKLE